MEKKSSSFSRRNFFKTSFGTLGAVSGTLAAKSVFGQALNLETPRQTLGPFFPDDGDPVKEIRENLDFRLPISEANDNDLTFLNGHKGKAQGQIVYLKGKVLLNKGNGTREPQPGAVIIMWNASASGRYNHRGDTETTRFKHPKTGKLIERTHDENFQYWGRCITDKQGNYWFKTIVPGFYPVDLEDGWYRPPHLHFMVTAPAIPQLVTQLYFKGNQVIDNDFIQELNAKDGILRSGRLKAEEQENLVVKYQKDTTGKITDGLVGNYDFVLSL
ncbi:dioxygenase family protein [Candidatus Nitrotoga sp. M5]|uniref:dioxygenase family protein n=1 Tax=Candidatus Nitrotoga sp. M5 TaxID=2890409 RepID=UPI001EF3F2EC|nr:hypothetical protein [Candidatus Nitrotoga sp. M5]CAH1388198.1 putative Intradiol ring-cleavage dioxygenase [Candidatus Nitrotoga sp. M5]